MRCCVSLGGRATTGGHQQQPDREAHLADDRGDRDDGEEEVGRCLVVGQDQVGNGVHDVGHAGGEQEPGDPARTAGPEQQHPQDHEVCAEGGEPGDPGEVEGLQRQQDRVVVAVAERPWSGAQPQCGVEEAERGAEHDGVGQAQPRRQQGQVAVDGAEEHPQRPGDDHVDHEDPEEAHCPETERGLGVAQRRCGACGVTGLQDGRQRQEVGEDRKDEDGEVASGRPACGRAGLVVWWRSSVRSCQVWWSAGRLRW